MLGKTGSSTSTQRGHQEVFAYWASLRNEGRLPSRAQIDPGALKRLLPTVSLIDVLQQDDTRHYRQRLAGTGLYPVYGREITGRALEDVYNTEDTAYWREQLDTVVRECRPMVGCHTLSSRPGASCSLLWIRLPLASDGHRIDMILGYDTIMGAPVARMSSGIRAA
jgi:hypothetical protein